MKLKMETVKNVNTALDTYFGGEVYVHNSITGAVVCRGNLAICGAKDITVTIKMLEKVREIIERETGIEL